MNTYIVTIESREYNPMTHKFENKQFEGEFQAKTEKGAKQKVKRCYAMELDTVPKEVKIVSIELV
jgi:hypothetical protein